MEEREENRNERLKKQFSELEEEWTAMKTGKASSAISWISVEEAFEFVENSPRNLMLSLQNDPKPEELIDEIRSPSSFKRKLFHDSNSDDEDDYKTKTTTTFSHSSCWSSNGTRVIDNNKKNKCRKIVIVTMLLLLSWLLINGFDHFSVTTQINTLVPT